MTSEDIQDSGVDQNDEAPAVISSEDAVKSALAEWRKSQEPKDEPAKAPEKSKPTKAADDDEFVEITDPAVQKRVNNLYKQVKSLEEKDKIWRKELQKQAEANEKLLQWKDEFEKGRAVEKEDREITLLRNRIRQARELGNEDEVDKLTEALIDLKTEQKLTKAQQKAYEEALHRQREAEAQQTTTNFRREDVEYMEKLRGEKADGETLRPWLHADDKDFELAQRVAAGIADDIIRKGEELTLEKVMETLDDTMFTRRGGDPRSKAKGGQAAVLSSRGTTTPPRQSQVRLTNEQRHMAGKLGIPVERYAKYVTIAQQANHVSIDDL